MSTAAEQKKAAVEVSTRGGETFVNDFYYKTYDTARNDLIRFYQEQSIVLWNGNPLKGVQVLSDWFKNLPASEHTIDSIDCHPIPASGNLTTILVSVNGKVSYAQGTSRIFNQTFVLAPGPNNDFFIAYDCMRLTT